MSGAAEDSSVVAGVICHQIFFEEVTLQVIPASSTGDRKKLKF
jgi:hypothetical protein